MAKDPAARLDQTMRLNHESLKPSKRRGVRRLTQDKFAQKVGFEAVAILRRPNLAEAIGRIKRLTAQHAPALAHGDEEVEERISDFDPLVEMAMIAADQAQPMEFRLFCLDRLRRYWYAELKPEDPEEKEKEAGRDDLAKALAERIRATLRQLDAKVLEDRGVIEGELVEKRK